MPLLSHVPLPGLALRPETPADFAFQESLYGTTRQEELDAAGFPHEQRPAFIAQQFHAQTVHYRRFYAGARWLIIEHAGQPIGRLILHEAPDHLNVVDIALLPEARGRGIGTALLRQVLAEAAERGVPVRMCAFVGERALALYLRLGFREIGNDGVRVALES